MGDKIARVDPIPSEDQEKNEDEEREALQPDSMKRENAMAVQDDDDDSSKKSSKKGKEAEDELSEEDRELKEKLELLVTRSQDSDAGVQKLALESLRTEIRSSTSSMTSVPKPLKFLQPFYAPLKEFFLAASSCEENQLLLADILSVMAMTMASEGSRDLLRFQLLGSREDVGLWGHEFVRNLTKEIQEEWNDEEKEKNLDDLKALVHQIVPYNMSHHAEHEAVDLLTEVDMLDEIIQHVTKHNYGRVCNYLVRCASYFAEPDDTEVLKVALNIYKTMEQIPEALYLAIRLRDTDTIQELFDGAAEDPALQRQLAFMLSRHLTFAEIEADDEVVMDILTNSNLTEYYLSLARDLDVTEAKTPDDIYKMHLVESRNTTQTVDSAMQNLASTFVNAFVNVGFGHDTLVSEDGHKWIYRNKEHGMLSATASLGMVLLWDAENAVNKIEKYTRASDNFIKAGGLLGIGLLNSQIRNECDPALAVLSDFVDDPTNVVRASAILGLGMAYAGTAREDLQEMLLPTLEDDKSTMDIVGAACVALGLIFVGTTNGDLTEAFATLLMTKSEEDLKSTHSRYICLGLGLLYLNRRELVEVPLMSVDSELLPEGIRKYAALTLQTCAYAGTGDVLMVQRLIAACGEHLDEDADTSHQAVAVLGIALVAMGEELGSSMLLRMFDHLLQYADLPVRQALPLALGLLSISDPQLGVMDTLSKLSHDQDNQVAQSAVLALGLIGAGTNNSRIAGLLRQLSSYYGNNAGTLFVVRLAQGLLHAGKGTMSLNPFYNDRLLMNPVGVGGLLVVLHSCLDMENIILGSHHYMLYHIVLAMFPRMLMTFDEELNPLVVDVRVGQAVDTVGQAGKPKTITGFQTHTTPVLLLAGERAELATDKYIAVNKNLEGFIILRKNPEAEEDEEDETPAAAATTTTSS